MNDSYKILPNTERAMLREGVLNDDMIFKASEGNKFGNNRSYKYVVEWFTFANAWCNHRHFFFAKTFKNAIERYKKLVKLTNEELDYINFELETF